MSTFHVDGYNTSVEITVHHTANGVPCRVEVTGCDPESGVGPAAVEQALKAEGYRAKSVQWETDGAYLSGVEAI